MALINLGVPYVIVTSMTYVTILQQIGHDDSLGLLLFITC